MRLNFVSILAIVFIDVLIWFHNDADAQIDLGVASNLQCGHFFAGVVSKPLERTDTHSTDRLATINTAVERYSASILFLGDSLTERWPEKIWNKYFNPLSALNAGVDGDRTEHLLWRMDHGNLRGNAPKVVVLLIGTNDLGHGRTPDVTAEGIRIDLMQLYQRLSSTKILLLGLLPRNDRFGPEINPVNSMIAKCDGGAVMYADVGKQLLNQPSREIFADGVHLTELGYEKISTRLKVILADLIEH